MLVHRGGRRIVWQSGFTACYIGRPGRLCTVCKSRLHLGAGVSKVGFNGPEGV
jgi:hypothetical protein